MNWWLSQPSFYIDSVSGDDKNLGTTALLPLKTMKELASRWGDGNLQGVTQVFCPKGLPSSDPLTFQAGLTALASLSFYGGATTTVGSSPLTPIQTGTFTSVATLARATNVPWAVADTATPLVTPGQRYRVTTGANAGNFGWIATSSGRCGAPSTLAGGITALGNVSVGDAYQVDQLPAVTLGNLPTPCTFQDFSFTNFVSLQTPSCTFQACAFPNGIQAAGNSTSLLNCCISSFSSVGVNVLVDGGLILLSCALAAGITNFDGDLLVQGASIFIQKATAILALVGSFDATAFIDNPRGSGIFVGPALLATGGSFLVRQSFHGGNGVYGSGSAGYGLDVGPGHRGEVIAAYASGLTITGASGDFILGGDTLGARAFDDLSGSYTPKMTSTWAHFATPVTPGPGFGGNAHGPLSDAHLVSG